MTGNVAQVFVDDVAWLANLRGIAGTVHSRGRLIFETRIPGRKEWEEWTRDTSWKRLEIPRVGVVASWVELTDVSLPLVSFKQIIRFEADAQSLHRTRPSGSASATRSKHRSTRQDGLSWRSAMLQTVPARST